MQKNVLNTDLTGKVAVVTGAGGVLCSDMAKALARAGAKVALLNRTLSKAQVHADAIVAEGSIAKAYQCNVLVENDCKVVAQQVLEDLGPCDILVNGAGGNSAKANTDKEFYEPGDIDDSTLQTFFTISPENVSSVLELNFLGTLLPTQVFAKQMLGRPGCCIVNISSMNAFTPLTKIPAYSGAKAAVSNFTQWLAVHFSREGIRVNAIAPGFFASEQNADPGRHPRRPDGPPRGAGGRAALPREQRGSRLHQRHRPAGGRRLPGLFGGLSAHKIKPTPRPPARSFKT